MARIESFKECYMLYKKLAKLKELRKRYYIDYRGVVQTYWQGSWFDYDYVSKFDKRLIIE